MRRAPLLLLAVASLAVAVAALLRPLRPFVAEPPAQLSLPGEGGTLELERLGPLPAGTPGLGGSNHGGVTVAGWRYRLRAGGGQGLDPKQPLILWLKLATSSARSNRTYLRPAPVAGSAPQELEGCLALNGEGLDPSGILRAAPATPAQRILWLLGLRPYNQQACWTLKP